MRRTLALTVVAATAVGSLLPAQAATKAKPKPKPITFTYEVSLSPDPTAQVTGQVKPACAGLLPQGKNDRAFTVPAAGRLKISLTAPEPAGHPAGHGVDDWDLYALNSTGTVEGESSTEFAVELIDVKFKKKTPLTIEVCELVGLPGTGKITVTFTYA